MGIADPVEETAVGNHKKEKDEPEKAPLHVPGPGDRHRVVAREEIDDVVRKEVAGSAEDEAENEGEEE